MKLSVVIPAHNEEGVIAATLRGLYATLQKAEISHELVVIDDNSSDTTADILRELAAEIPSLRTVTNSPPNGYGLAVRRGIDVALGEYVAVNMADASDDPDDLVAFFRKAEEGYDAVFGNRFARGGKVIDYPWPKLILNRITNGLICLLFASRYTDTTNAFKLYRRDTLEGLKPFLSHHFNLTVELPLKTIVRGYSYTVLPNRWYNRKHGESKLRIKEMGSRYWFVIFYCLIEKWLSVGDYQKRPCVEGEGD
ncbi:MAG: glycosyltransferase family 2 protein [Lentisphaerae bacterium]|nr:glycosyltransferase family 2 protein [Lentisphaerota bacterium]